MSIVTPSYNQAPFLEEAIRSVLLQDYPDLEYFVIDGGSTDGSVEIIRRYAPWLAHWVSEPDRGQSDAVNKAWMRATGEILAYLNSDDLYPPGAVRAAVGHLCAHPEVGVVYGAYTVIDERGAVLEPLRRPSAWTPAMPMRGLPAHAMFFRRDVLARVGFLDIGLHFAMDADLCARLALAGVRFERVPGGALIRVRHWPGAKSFNWSEAALAEVWGNWERLARSPGAPPGIRDRLPAILAKACLWPAYRSLERGLPQDARRLLWRSVRTHWPIALSGEFLRILGGALLGPRARALLRSMRQPLRRRR
ncbi:MAG TPA: glycosyltransferase family 2 protein [Methylomirabilota bacterium]|nr:glycosyltransferase family 2 protein [Methylomirabilota bacterium]